MVITEILSTIEDDEQRNELEDFFIRYNRQLYATALSILNNCEDAEDATQEVFLRIADNPTVFCSLSIHKKLKYAYVTIKHISYDKIKKHTPKSLDELTDDIPLSDVSLEDKVIGKVSADKIKHFIKGIPERQRDVIYFHCTLGMTLEETAIQLNITPSAVKKLLMRGRKSILDYITKELNDNE